MSASESNVNSPEDDWDASTSSATEEGDSDVAEASEEKGSFEADPKSLSDLKSLRKLIDQKNKSIVRLLNRRAGYALRIAEVKRTEGLALQQGPALRRGAAPHLQLHHGRAPEARGRAQRRRNGHRHGDRP